jgi:CubicO group peptidase (beta-lactamase class C family)
MKRHSRREFVTRVSCGGMPVAIGARTLQAAAPSVELERFIEAEMQAQRIPGLAACIVKSGKIVWSKGYGWSDIKRRVAMDPERTIQNIGSISKTVTATAAMQLWENIPLINGQINEVVEACKKFGILGGDVEGDASKGGYQPLCLYSFPNYPDGSLRSSLNQLARFLIAYINQGVYGKVRILDAYTVRLMLTRQHATPAYQGLCWVTLPREGRPHWFHNGSDPGIRTNMSFQSSDGVGAIVFVNRSDIELNRFNDRLFQEAGRFLAKIPACFRPTGPGVRARLRRRSQPTSTVTADGLRE